MNLSKKNGRDNPAALIEREVTIGDW